MIRLFILASCCLAQGCFSTKVGENIERYKLPEKELLFSEDNEIIWLGGEIQNSDAGRRLYQFENVLKGEGRVLLVSIPQDTNSKSLVFDGDRKAKIINPSYLITIDPEYLSLDKMLNENNLKNNGVSEIIFICMICRESHPFAVGRAELHDNCQIQSWEKYSANYNISWVERNMLSYHLIKLQYLVSVPLDVLTSPLQLFTIISHNY